MKISKLISLTRKVNTLTLENETLKEIIKDKLYKNFMNMYNDSLTVAQLREELKIVRASNKDLKEMLKGDFHDKTR